MSGSIGFGPFEDLFSFLLKLLFSHSLVFGHWVEGVLLVLWRRKVCDVSGTFGLVGMIAEESIEHFLKSNFVLQYPNLRVI